MSGTGDGFGYVSQNIVNQALIALGHPRVLGTLRDGSKEANAALEVYAPTVEEISRAVHWGFARKQVTLTLLQDASGVTGAAQAAANLPVTVGNGTVGMGQWLYEYAWPIDCMKARYIPANYGVQSPVPANNIVPSNPAAPLTTAPNSYPNTRTVPAPFMVSQDMIPNLIGVPTAWNQMPDLDGAQGQDYGQQTVLLTNTQNATLVYTSLVASPNVWDPLFRQAVVGLLAAKLAMVVLEDKKMAMAMQPIVIKNAAKALENARLADGNEAPGNIRREASWIGARGSQRGWQDGDIGSGSGGGGILWGGWEYCPFPDGNCY